MEGNKIYLKGILGKTAYRRMKRTLIRNPDIDTLVFIQSDGSENDDYNVLTGKLIYENEIVTKLLPNSEIASGAVDLFLAGKKRVVPKGAKIGIHSWKDQYMEGRNYPKEHEVHEVFWQYYEQIGIDTIFYWFTLYTADYDAIHWLSEEEISRFNIRSE
jgi:hypothetical protein